MTTRPRTPRTPKTRKETLTVEGTRKDARLEAMREAAGDEMYLADLTAAMEDFSHADRNAYHT